MDIHSFAMYDKPINTSGFFTVFNPALAGVVFSMEDGNIYKSNDFSVLCSLVNSLSNTEIIEFCTDVYRLNREYDDKSAARLKSWLHSIHSIHGRPIYYLSGIDASLEVHPCNNGVTKYNWKYEFKYSDDRYLENSIIMDASLSVTDVNNPVMLKGADVYYPSHGFIYDDSFESHVLDGAVNIETWHEGVMSRDNTYAFDGNPECYNKDLRHMLTYFPTFKLGNSWLCYIAAMISHGYYRIDKNE